ncbi:MAG TPA: DUF4412 domain-containing protein [Chitinophagaceae bacterium]|nr:DUF4412 domain-containing protein [Chitinophagaceae bacterium]
MKKNKITAFVFIIMPMMIFSSHVNAQFLKKILNDVKQTTQNRADQKADDATNKAIDGITQPNSKDNSSKIDTAALGGVLGAFAKAAKDNPNDTSGADLTMKALGNLAGGGGVSAADSVAAIQTYMSANGGSGIYYEYTIESNTKERGVVKSTTKMYLTNSGEGRSEMNMAAMMGVKNGNDLIVIGKMNQPHYSVMLDDENKMYSLNVIDTALINSSISKDEVTKIGNETVDGYNCTHAKLVTTTGAGMFKSSSTMDVWTSVDVPGYDLLKQATLQQNVTPAMMKALNDAGCGGFFVKMASNDKGYSFTMQLTKAEKQSFPSSLFKIPSGYTESKNNLMIGNMMNAAASQQK